MTIVPRPWFAVAAALLLSVVLWLPAPARADAGRYLTSPSFTELTTELEGLQKAQGSGFNQKSTPAQQQRLADLQALQTAIAASDDRSQISNKSTHSVGVFARYKKEPATSPAGFYVLGPGHATDDDYEVVGLFVPADISLSWGAEAGAPATSAPRIARILEGQQLNVKDLPAPAAEAAPATANAVPAAKSAVATTEPPLGYALNLPVFALQTNSDAVASLPSLSQVELDGELETAPLD